MALTKIPINAFRCFFCEISNFLNFISQNRMKSSLKLGFFNFSSAIFADSSSFWISSASRRSFVVRVYKPSSIAFIRLSNFLLTSRSCFFQQRNRCVLLILDIHDQLNDLVDHRIVLNQLHGLPDDQIFQPVLLHGLFVAALAPFNAGAFIIIVGAPGSTGSVFAEHQRTTLAAEQLGGQQIFLICLASVLSGKLNDVPSGRLFRADSGFLQMCQSL